MGTPPDLRQKNQKKKQKCRLFCCLWLLLQLLLLIIIKKLIHCIIKSISLRKIRHTTLELMMMILINQMKLVAVLGIVNNVAQMIQNKIEKAHNECDYWPREDNERCLRAVTACILETLALIGELKRHMNLKSERCDELNLGNNKGAKAAIKSAKASAKQVVEYVLKQERWAKTFCGSQDDACKDNVECKILADVADIYRDNIELQACDIKREDYETTYPDEPPSPKTRKN